MFDLGLILQELRNSNNYTQTQVARRLNVSVATVGRWENNYKTPSTEHLIDLSVQYNVSLNYLVGREKEKAIVIERLTKWCYVKITDTLNLYFLGKSAKCTKWSHLFHGLLDNEPLMA